jgi:hypothetical protein
VFRWSVLSSVLLFAIDCTFALAGERVDPLGARAVGMGGAFTAVADDGSSFFWNPAGLAFGPVFQGAFYWGDARMDRGGFVSSLAGADGSGRAPSPSPSPSLWTDRASGFSVGMPFLGVAGTFGRSTSSSRDRDLASSRGLETFDLAVSVAHSLPPDNLVVAANLHYLRATAHDLVEGVPSLVSEDRTPDAFSDRVAATEGRTSSTGTFDVAALYAPKDWLRVGMMWKRLTRPKFATPSGEIITLPRTARAGVAFFLPRHALVSFDIDLSRQGTETEPDGWRELALGAEQRFFDDALSLRAGVRGEIGSRRGARPAFSVGAGAKVRFVRVDLAYVGAKVDRDRSLWFTITLSP